VCRRSCDRRRGHRFWFAGCAHAKKSSVRQLLLLDKETLDAMDLRSVASAKISPQKASIVNGLALGEHLRIGPVLLQVSAVCTPCDQLRTGTAGVAPRNIWQARDVVPSPARWNNSRRRRDRARGSGFLVSPKGISRSYCGGSVLRRREGASVG
jgi:hypothetical protein